MQNIGLIGGYSTYKILDNYSEITKGNLTCFKGRIGNKNVYIIPRHGKSHKFPPHRVPLIDYFEFLKKNNVKDLVTVYSVGVINRNWKVPCLVVIDDFIDFTGELVTIYDFFDKQPVHVEMDEPYFKPYKKIITKVTEQSNIPLYHGVYFQTIGPRLETKAEIRAARIFGADVVGMTHSWEAILAREYCMRLLSLGMGVNYACGIKNKINSEDIINESRAFSEKTIKLIKKFIERVN